MQSVATVTRGLPPAPLTDDCPACHGLRRVLANGRWTRCRACAGRHEPPPRVDPQACPICRGAGWLSDHGKAVPCECLLAKRRARELEQLAQAANLPNIADKTFETFRPDACRPVSSAGRMREILDTCREYAATLNGWLVLQGPCGCGKTHLAYAVANACIGEGRSVYYQTVPRMLDHLRAGYQDGATVDFEARMRGMETVDLLILDDFGTEKSSEWGADKLFQLVNERYINRQPLVVTTNLDVQGGQGIDPRLRSRLLEGTRTVTGFSQLLVLPADDYRPWA